MMMRNDITTSPNEKIGNVKFLRDLNNYEYQPDGHLDFIQQSVDTLDNRSAKYAKMELYKNYTEQKTDEAEKQNGRQLLVMLMKCESEINDKRRPVDSKANPFVKSCFCWKGKKMTDSCKMTSKKKCKNSEIHEYKVDCKAVKVSNNEKDLINDKLQGLSDKNQTNFLDGLVRDGYLDRSLKC